MECNEQAEKKNTSLVPLPPFPDTIAKWMTLCAGVERAAKVITEIDNRRTRMAAWNLPVHVKLEGHFAAGMSCSRCWDYTPRGIVLVSGVSPKAQQMIHGDSCSGRPA
jgi:hypothetical protein